MSRRHPHSTPFVRRPWPLLAAILAAAMAGCGPGLGGTGTGSVADALLAFGAEPSSVCTADVGATLACAGVATALAEGTLPTRFADAAQRIVVTYTGQTAALEDRCSGLRFDGLWGRTGSSGGDRWYGLLSHAGQEVPDLASLAAAAADAGAQSVSLRSVNGALLLGPVRLQPAGLPGTALPAPVCPGA